jgi:hypothetical protein
MEKVNTPDQLVVSEASDGSVSILSAGKVNRESAAAAIDAAHTMGDQDPLRLQSGQSVSFEVSAATRLLLLPELAPVEELFEKLDDLYGSDGTGGPEGWGDSTTIDEGNFIDGAPWSWVHTLDAWNLVPAGEGDNIAYCSMEQTMSMVSGANVSGLRRWDDVAVIWYRDDNEGLTWSPIDYGVTDWDAELLRLVGGTFEIPGCPCCDDGVIITIDIDESFGLDVRTKIVGIVFEPCVAHGSDCVLTNTLGVDWRWNGTAWTPKPRP